MLVELTYVKPLQALVAMQALQHAPGLGSAVGGARIVPMLLTPCCSAQGDGGTPEVTPASGTGDPTLDLR